MRDVTRSVLKTLQNIDQITEFPIEFSQLFYYTDEVLADHDVKEALEELEQMGLVKRVDGGFLLTEQGAEYDVGEDEEVNAVFANAKAEHNNTQEYRLFLESVEDNDQYKHWLDRAHDPRASEY